MKTPIWVWQTMREGVSMTKKDAGMRGGAPLRVEPWPCDLVAEPFTCLTDPRFDGIFVCEWCGSLPNRGEVDSIVGSLQTAMADRLRTEAELREYVNWLPNGRPVEKIRADLVALLPAASTDTEGQP